MAPKQFSTYDELGAAAGVSKATVHRDIKRPDFPLGDSPWSEEDVEVYIGWRETRRHGNVADEADPLRREMIRKTRGAADLAELKVAREIGDVVSANDMNSMLARIRSVVVLRILQVPASVAPLVIGKDEREATAIIDAALRDAFSDLTATAKDYPAEDAPINMGEVLSGTDAAGEN